MFMSLDAAADAALRVQCQTLNDSDAVFQRPSQRLGNVKVPGFVPKSLANSGFVPRQIDKYYWQRALPVAGPPRADRDLPGVLFSGSS